MSRSVGGKFKGVANDLMGSPVNPFRRRTYKVTLLSRIGKSRISIAGRKPLDSKEWAKVEEDKGGRFCSSK
mgnify:FL=1